MVKVRVAGLVVVVEGFGRFGGEGDAEGGEVRVWGDIVTWVPGGW